MTELSKDIIQSLHNMTHSVFSSLCDNKSNTEIIPTGLTS